MHQAALIARPGPRAGQHRVAGTRAAAGRRPRAGP